VPNRRDLASPTVRLEEGTKIEGSAAPNTAEVVRELFLESRPELMRYLAFRVRNAAESEELAQEVYVRMMRLDQVHLIRNPRAYLFRVAASVLTDRGRLQSRRITTEEMADAADQLADGGAGPYEQLLWRQRLDRVNQAINDLPERCRRALVLHRRDGWTYDEIAADLGVSRSMVKKYLRKALVLCRRALAEEELAETTTEAGR
jgi:RNA polymerase sigma factor (sigma-70 family)